MHIAPETLSKRKWFCIRTSSAITACRKNNKSIRGRRHVSFLGLRSCKPMQASSQLLAVSSVSEGWVGCVAVTRTADCPQAHPCR